VAKFRFSRRAEDDLLAIANYTLRKWGKAFGIETPHIGFTPSKMPLRFAKVSIAESVTLMCR
jgi:hypothetical protein